MKTQLLGLGYFFHRIYLLRLLVLHFPHAPESPRTNLVYEVVWIASHLPLRLLHHQWRRHRRILLTSEQRHVKILFHELFRRFDFNNGGVFGRVKGRFDFFGKLISFLSSIKKGFFIHVNIGVQLYHITINNFFEADGGVSGGDFVDTFPIAGGFLGSSIH